MGRNWKWFVPTAGCLTVLLAAVGFFGAIFFFVFNTIRSSEPVVLAMERVQSNPRLQRELGEPIELGWIITGAVNDNGLDGEADLWLPVSGPKESARVHLVASQEGGYWEFSRLDGYIGDDGTARIDLLEPNEQ